MRLTILIFLCLPLFVKGQDIMILKNGDEIKIKTLEILTDVIKYKKWDNLDGPIRSELKQNVFMIKYQNGTKEVIESQQASNPTSQTSGASAEDTRKSIAVEKLKGYFVTQIQNSPKLRFKDFTKVNGVMKNIFGQNVYEIDFKLRLQFLESGWVVGNFVMGYFNQNFNVYDEEKKMGFNSDSKFFEKGTELELTGTGTMESTDNGYKIQNYKVKSMTSFGVKPTTTAETPKPVERKKTSEPNWLTKTPNGKTNLTAVQVDILSFINDKYNIQNKLNQNTTIDSFYGKFMSTDCKKGYLEFTYTDKASLVVLTNKRGCINLLGNDKNQYDYHNGILFREISGYNDNGQRFNVQFIYLNEKNELIFNECATIENGDFQNKEKIFKKE